VPIRIVGHVIADLFQQVAGLARERDRKDEVVDPMYDEEWGVLAAALAQQLIDREMQCSDDPARGRGTIRSARARGCR